MLGHFLVFTKSGFVLWNHDVEHGSASSGSTSSAVAHRVASQLVSRILVQGRNAENVFKVEGYEAQWLISNDHNLVFAVRTSCACYHCEYHIVACFGGMLLR